MKYFIRLYTRMRYIFEIIYNLRNFAKLRKTPAGNASKRLPFNSRSNKLGKLSRALSSIVEISLKFKSLK